MFLGSCLSGSKTLPVTVLGSGTSRGHGDEETAGMLQREGLGEGVRGGSSLTSSPELL